MKENIITKKVNQLKESKRQKKLEYEEKFISMKEERDIRRGIENDRPFKDAQIDGDGPITRLAKKVVKTVTYR